MNEQYDRLSRAINFHDIESFKKEWSPEAANSCRNIWGGALLHEVVSLCWIRFVKFMLENGANPNIRTLEGGSVPLMSGWLCAHGNRIAVHLILLKHGGNPYLENTDGRNSFGGDTNYMESFLVVELVCGEVDRIPIDIWRVVKPFIYNI